MKTFMKYAVTATMAGALALAAASPSEARGGGNAAAAIGFGAGALVGAAAVSNGYAYGEPGYAYAPGYAYEPGYETYAYQPAPRYYVQRHRTGGWDCTDDLGSARAGFGGC